MSERFRRWFGLRCALRACPCVCIHGKARCADCRKVFDVYDRATNKE